MLKKVSFIAAILASAAMASPSFAQSFSPSTGSVSGSGNVDLQQTTTLNCNVSVTANPMGSTSAPIPTRSISAGDFLCIVVAPYGSWGMAVVPGATDKISLTIGANTVTNAPCYGTTVADWDNVTRTITFNNNVLPAVDPTDPDCTILSGSITVPGLQIL